MHCGQRVRIYWAIILFDYDAINNLDDDLFISLAVTCDQQSSAVGRAIYIVLRPSNGWTHYASPRPSVRPTRQLEQEAKLSLG